MREGLLALLRHAAQHGFWPYVARQASPVPALLFRAGRTKDAAQGHKKSDQTAREILLDICHACALGSFRLGGEAAPLAKRICGE